MKTHLTVLCVILLGALFGCGGSTDDPYNLNYDSKTLVVEFSDNTYASAQRIVIQTKGERDGHGVYPLKNKTRSGFSFAITDVAVTGHFAKGKLDESTLCGDQQLYDLKLTYAPAGTSTTLQGSRVPCEG